MHVFRGPVIALALCAAAACNQSDFGDDDAKPPGDMPDGPGDPAWSDVDLSCSAPSDCAINEDCIDGLCQMPRCVDGPYDSAPPIGDLHTFFSDREIITADTSAYENAYWIDGYHPDGDAVSYPTGGGSYRVGAAAIVDVAGGNVAGERPHGLVAALSGRRAVAVVRGGERFELALPFAAIAVATGDVDHDSLDEVIALSATNRFSICDADARTCDTYAFADGTRGVDVAAADVDGDLRVEAVFALELDGATEVVAFNVDAEATGEDAVTGVRVDTSYLALDAGDVDGDGVAEVLALEDGGWLGFASDHLHVYRLGATPSRLASIAVDADAKDVALADLGARRRAEVLVLRDTRTVDVLRGDNPAALAVAFTGELSVTSAPDRIASADVDGDSPSARRIAGPDLVSGDVVPTMVMHWPPYSREHSDGLPYLFVGDSENTSEAFTDSVSLRLGVDVGVSAEFPGIGGAEVMGLLRQHVEASVTQSRSFTVGSRYWMEPDPELHGTDYATVVLSSGCFHSYTYELDDPAEIVGGDGAQFVVVVPVGGQATLWSSKRYNALAAQVPGLPEIEVAHKLGDLSTYPASFEKPDGSPIPEEDLVFPKTPGYQTSDVGKVGWWLAVAESETNSVAMSTEVGARGSVNVAGFKFGTEVAAGWGSAYALTVGNEALFGGAVPAIPDDPATPEDEHQQYRFSFKPVVYREHYTDADDADAAFYVLDFAVAR